MQIPDFHDGYFDGIWIGPNKRVQLFLRTVDGQSFVLSLEGAQRLAFSDIKQGNIILDLVFRKTKGITPSDIAELYGVGVDTPQCASLMKAATEPGLQVLEINLCTAHRASHCFRPGTSISETTCLDAQPDVSGHRLTRVTL
jgi:hypothetical protein